MIEVENRDDFIKELAKHLPENSVCIELGVYRGELSATLLNIVRPKKLHLVDPWKIGNDKNGVGGYGFIEHTAYASNEDYKYVKAKFASEISANKVVIHRKYSYNAVAAFPDKYFDMIYIDACHLYDAVKCDLRDYLPKLKAGGLMCGHDYVNVNNFGVIRAVDEFIAENGFEFLLLNKGQHDWATKRIVK